MIGLDGLEGWLPLIVLATVDVAITVAVVAAAAVVAVRAGWPHPGGDPRDGAAADPSVDPSVDPNANAHGCAAFGVPLWSPLAASFGAFEWGAVWSWPASTTAPGWWVPLPGWSWSGAYVGVRAAWAPWAAAGATVAAFVASKRDGSAQRQRPDGDRPGAQAGASRAAQRAVDEGRRRGSLQVVPPHAAGPAP